MAAFERDVLRGLENLIGDEKFAVGDNFTVADLAATARVTAALERPRVWYKSKPTAEEVKSFEEDVIKGLEHLLGDGKFVVGDKLTVADLALFAHLTLAIENDSIDKGKFPKLANYHERVKHELPYLEEIYRPAIDFFKQLWAELK
ncbi:hypothetical protein MTO96_039662 [Rhipicephalus appendiculatus]